MSARAANAYRRVYLESAAPTRILDELFGRLLADLEDARQKITVGDRGGKGHAIDHAMAIVAELSAALDFTAAPEICANLKLLYVYVNERLVDANVRIDRGPIDDAERVVLTLREAFQGATSGGTSASSSSP